MTTAGAPNPLTEIEEVKTLVDSGEQQQLVISILEDVGTAVGESEQIYVNRIMAGGAPKPLTEIEELKKLIDSGEQQLVISILEAKKHIREQKNFNSLIKTAVINKREEILIWFVRNLYDKNKNAALEMAVNSGIENVIYLALDCDGVNVNEGLYFAVKANKLHVIKLLLAQEADVDYIRNGYTLLHTAIMQNCELSIVEYFIHKVKDLDAVAKNKKTALEIVQELLKKNKDGTMKEYLEKILNLIMLTKQTKAIMFECLQGLPDNLRGYSYQIKLLTLYAIVCTKLASSSDCEFELGTEATDQVPFDDIYIKEKRNGRTNCQFVQVKQTKSPQYNQMKESKFFTVLKTDNEINVKEHLKGNDTIIKMFMAFDKISHRYLQNEISGKFIYATTMYFENNSCNFFVPKVKDDLLCGVGGQKWQISETYYLELEIKFVLLNLLASSHYITIIDVNAQSEIEKQIKIINDLQVNDIINRKLSDNILWSVFEIAKLGLKAIEGYLNKLKESRIGVNSANDEVSLKNSFPQEFEMPQNRGNFKAYKTNCLTKISELCKSLKDDKALWVYFSKWNDEAIFTETMNSFVLHFCMYTDCPNTEILDDIITEEICHELMVHKSDIFSSYCLQHFSKWIINFKNQRGNLYTDRDGKKLFSDLTEQVFKGFSKMYDEDLQRYNISFNNDNAELLNFLSNENNNKILHVVTEHPRLHTIKVLNTLKMYEGQTSDFNYARNVFATNTEIIFKSDDTVKKVIKIISANVEKNYFILELVNNVHECNRSFDFLNKLQTTIAQNTQSKIILVGKNDNLIALALKYTHLPSRKYVWYNEVISFKNLTEESQEFFLERPVIFINSPDLQGINLKLQNFLTPSAACDFIDEVLLSGMVTNENNIQIGNSSAFYSDEYNVDYYIPRTVNRQILDKSILTHSDKHLFFVTGISAENLISTFNVQEAFVHYWQEGKTFDVGIVLIHDHNDKKVYNNNDIFTLVSDSCRQNTYWLDIRDNLIFWNGLKIKNISDHVHLKVSEMNKKISGKYRFTPKELVEKIVILANNAGEGKSTMLTDLAHALKEKYPRHWIVRVDLKNYVHKTLAFSLNNIEFTDEETSKAVEFVAHMIEKENSKINEILERKVFEAALNGLSQMEVVLIFDGFDEISPGYKEETCTLLKALAKSKVRQLWVATRIHLKEYLEEQLQAAACMLTPFSEAQAIQYLNRFWKWKLKNYKVHSETDTNENIIAGALGSLRILGQNYRLRISKNVFNVFITKISNFKSDSLADFCRFIDEAIDLSDFARLTFTSLSVQQIEKKFLNVPLNLEVFAENLFANKWDQNNIKNLQLYEIYKQFVDNKFEIYKHVKSTTQSGRPADKDQGDIASVVFRDMHREIAVKTLFEPSESLPDINVCKKHEGLYEKLPRVGLMKVNGDRFEFTHRTYAEYFIIEYLDLHIKNYNLQCEILPKILIKKDFFTLRKLFNGFLSQLSLKSDNRVETNYSLNNILMPPVSKTIVSELDEKCNNVLHIALLEDHTHIFMFILNNIMIDDFLNMKVTLSVGTPMLHTAVDLMVKHVFNYLSIAIGLIAKVPEIIKVLSCNHVGTCLHEVAILNRLTECNIILKTVKKHEGLLKNVLTAKASSGYTPIEYALIFKNTDIVNLFVKTAEECISDDIIISDTLPNIYSNCDIDITWSLSEIIAMLQKLRKGDTFSLEKLGSDSCKVSALHLAAYKGDVATCFKIMGNYLYKDQILNSPWNIGTPLHLATEYGHSEVCELIIKLAKQNVHVFEDLIKKCNDNKKTALDIAVLKGQNDICDIIVKSIEYDFDILQDLILKVDSRGRNVLHLAAYAGYSKICGMIIECAQNYPSILKVLLKSKDLHQKTSLRVAAAKSNSDMCDIIIMSAESNPDPDIFEYLLTEFDNTEQTVLHTAVASGSADTCNVILEAAERHPHIFKCLLKKCDNAEDTPLHKAAQFNHNEVFDLIATYALNNQDVFDAVIFKKNKNKVTPLHIAAIKGNAKMCTSIVTFAENHSELLGDLLMDEDRYGETALHIAAKRGQSEVCHVIINSMRTYPDILRAVLFKCNINKHTALHAAAGAGLIGGVPNKTLWQNDVYNTFTAKKGLKLPKCKNIELNIPQDRTSAVVIILMKATEDINILKRLIMQCDKYERTVLHIAALSNNAETCKVIMNSAKEFNISNELITKRDKDERTALHLAAQYDRLTAFEVIIKHVQDNRDMLKHLINKCDKYKQNVLSIAIINERSDVCNVIMKYVTKYTDIFRDVIINKINPLHLVADYGNIQICKSIITSIESEDVFIEVINQIDDNSRTVLHVAASKNEIGVYEVIMSVRKQYPNAIEECLKKCDKNKQTVLHVAAENGHDEFCNIILLSTNTYGDVFQYLITECDKNEQTPLHLAAKGGYSNTCELILKFAKQNPNIYEYVLSKRDINKRTASDLAIANGLKESIFL